MSAPHLKVVEFDDNGEVHKTDCEHCKRKNDEIAGLERDIRGWAVRYAELKRDKDAEAREHPMWQVGEALFREWRTLCRHSRCQWTPERFWQAERFLTGTRFGATADERVVWIRRGIAGIAYDAFRTTRRNGSVKVHDDWELLFRTEDKFREWVSRAPKGWTP